MQAIIPFGPVGDEKQAHLHLLSNEAGALVGVSDLGANLVCCRMPDGHGNMPDVLLGHSGAPGYINDGLNLGAIIGRCTNRIAGASFEVAGTSYRLAANDGPNNLHSGPHKWSERLWKVLNTDDESVTFELTSRKGDQGFPGSVQVHVTYRLSETNQLMIYYSALPSEPTIINLTNHAYWNLNGHASGSVLDHTLQLEAKSYTPLENHIPTGEIAPVKGTPYDFTTARPIGAFIETLPSGYDDNFCLDNEGKVTKVARLVGDKSGISMTVSTDAPGLQVFTADFIDIPWGKDGAHYGAFSGISLEAQYYPDAIHHKNFKQPVFTPTRPYVNKTIYSFGYSRISKPPLL